MKSTLIKYKVWMGSSKDSKREGWWKPHPVLDHLGLISNEYTVILKFLKGSNVEFLNLRFCCYFYSKRIVGIARSCMISKCYKAVQLIKRIS